MKKKLAIITLVLFFAISYHLWSNLKWKGEYYKDDIILIAKELFAKFDGTEVFLNKPEIKKQLSNQQQNLLLKKLNTPFVQVTYSNSESTFIYADSVVLFTKTGFPIGGNEQNILIDMRYNANRPIIPGREYKIFERLSDRVYYIKTGMGVLGW